MIKTRENVYDTVLINENEAHIVGTITEIMEGSWMVSTKRLSGICDNIEVKVPFLAEDYNVGDRVEIFGKLRSYRMQIGPRNRLFLHIVINTVKQVDGQVEDKNEISICGYLNRDGYVRETPLGRNIMDFFLSVQVSTLKNGRLVCDTIPCIAWGGNAARGRRFAKHDTYVKAVGRLQERHYQKQLKSGEVVEMMVHELSCSAVYYDIEE